MTDSIQDYVKTKQLESALASGLMEQLSYLLSTREEIVAYLSHVDAMIEGIVTAMTAAGISVR